MTLKRKLIAIVSAIAEEADQNPSFRERIEKALDINAHPDIARPQAEGPTKKKGGRRTPALLDPVEYARLGEATLRAKLGELTLEQLRDIVAQYGMDPGKLVMKWKDTSRVIDRIVELALARATKGDAFRADSPRNLGH